jgi:Ca-activated chloride channel family protein
VFNLEERLFKSKRNPKLLPVQVSVHLDIEVEGLLVKTIITQTFTNTSDEPIEAIHTIPVPSDSTLVDFKVHKNNQTWQGSVMAKSKADQAYEVALEEGNSAFQLKRSKEDIFSLALGNLLSKETLSIELEIAFPLQWISGQGQLYLPLVMGERYGESSLLPEESPENSFLAEYPLSMQLKLSGALESANVESPSHPLIQRNQDNVYEIKDEAFLDRDLKIKFSNVTKINPSFRVNKHGEDFLGLINLVTPVNTNQIAESRDILFVLDCSGSMSGTPMTQLKKVMRNLLGQMRPQDRFNLYPYGSTIVSVFDDIQPVTEDNLLKAKRYIRRNLSANLGGTQTLRALLTALMSYKKGQTVDIVLVTDGDVWMNQDDNEFKLVKAYANQENIRIFPIGVGHATTEKTVKELAEMSNGSYVLTNPNEDISFTIESHFKRLLSEPLNITLRTENEWHQIPTVYQGDGIQIPVLFKTEPGQVDIEVLSNHSKQSYTVKQTVDSRSGIQKWVAYQSYKTLDSELKESFALEHQILTDKTDYLVELIRQESEKTDEMPSLMKIPQMEVYESNVGQNKMSSYSRDNYLDVPKFLRKPMDSYDGVMMSVREDIPQEMSSDITEQKQILELIEYLNKVTSGEVNFEMIKLAELDLSEDMLDSLRLIILSSDEAQAIKLLIQLCTNHSDWSSIADRLYVCGRMYKRLCD